MVPDAGVRHHVPPGRQRPVYFLQRCFYEGVGKAQLRHLATSAALSSERSYALRVLPAGVLREIGGSIRLDHPVARLSRAAAIVGGLGAAAMDTRGDGEVRSAQRRFDGSSGRQSRHPMTEAIWPRLSIFTGARFQLRPTDEILRNASWGLVAFAVTLAAGGVAGSSLRLDSCSLASARRRTTSPDLLARVRRAMAARSSSHTRSTS
jgi:hypothetical protein